MTKTNKEHTSIPHFSHFWIWNQRFWGMLTHRAIACRPLPDPHRVALAIMTAPMFPCSVRRDHRSSVFFRFAWSDEFHRLVWLYGSCTGVMLFFSNKITYGRDQHPPNMFCVLPTADSFGVSSSQGQFRSADLWRWLGIHPIGGV